MGLSTPSWGASKGTLGNESREEKERWEVEGHVAGPADPSSLPQLSCALALRPCLGAHSRAGHTVEASGSWRSGVGRGEQTPVRSEPDLPPPRGGGWASWRGFRRSRPERRSPGEGWGLDFT